MKISVIITGATGMVGEGVLFECLENPAVEKILLVNRRPSEVQHPKVREVVHANFFDLKPIEGELAGYDACFFCLGVSSVGMSTEDYRHATYDLTLTFAQALARHTPNMTFVYVTGKGTDSTVNGKVAWARVKGATENALLKLFPKSYMFRPGMMKATVGQKRLSKWYKYIDWTYPLGRKYFPSSFCTLREVAQAMIHVATRGGDQHILEVEDIVKLA